MINSKFNLLVFTLRFIAVVQFVLGADFMLVPTLTAQAFGLPPAPAWTAWLFAMMGARFVGYGYGLLVAARDPRRHRAWIGSMVFIQAADWLATLWYLGVGAVTLAQVSTAAFLPVVFIILVAIGYRAQAEVAR